MGKKKQILQETRDLIISMKDRGYTQVAISTVLKISESSISKILKRHQEYGSSCVKKRSGRPRVTTRRCDNLIKRYSVSKPTATASEIRANLPNPLVVSDRTIRRRLQKDFGLKSCKPARKPWLSSKNLKDWLAFCEKYKDWTTKDWSKVMYSDESMVCQFANFTGQVRRPVGKRYDPKYTIATVKNPPKVMVWGGISVMGRCGLWFLPPKTTMNGKIYLEMLKDKLPPFMELRGTTIFQQDGAPCHTSKMVKAWLTSQGIQILEPWPGNSPDLNPIENCWTTMKKKVSNELPTSHADLCQKIKTIWTQHITQKYCEKLIKSMPDRIQAVIANKGHLSKY